MSAHSDNLKVSVSVRAESRWRHRDRGTNYTVLAVGRIESKFWIEPSIYPEPGPVDMRSVVVYRSEEDGATWVRPVSEFMDGRFEALSSAPVEEADAKAEALYGPYGWIVKPVGLAEDEWELEADPEEDTVNFVSVPLYAAEPQALGVTAPPASTIPSEPEAKGEAGAERTRLDLGNLLAIIHRDGGHYELEHGTAKAVEEAHRLIGALLNQAGEAGAGPVGEAVAFIDPADLAAFADLKRRGLRGAATVRSDPAYSKTTPLYARPAEKAAPIPAESLVEAVAKAISSYGHPEHVKGDGFAWWWHPLQDHPGNALAHEFREEDRARARLALEVIMQDPAALSTQESSAALAGDGKEAGR